MADSQHPDIAALVERIEMVANDLGPINAETCMKAAAALRTLARPVEDEKVRDQIGFLGRVADHIARVLSPATAEKVRQAASLLARLAREKASAEQEIARLRKFLRTSLAVVDESGNATADQIGILQEAERALAAAAGAEQPR